MMEEQFLIWLDILGFEGLAKEIAKETRIAERKIRTDFINTINGRIQEIETKGEIIGKNYGERDDWILVTSSLNLAFKSIFDILNHNTDYKNYEIIPLEIAIGVGIFDKWAKFDGVKLVIENSTIEFLKTKIIGYYHEWYEQNHDGKWPSSTFVILTECTYRELEPLDTKFCQKIEYKNQEKKNLLLSISLIKIKFNKEGRCLNF